MKKKPKPPARYTAAHAVFLCVDSATTSGAAILVPQYDNIGRFTGKFEAETFGVVKTQIQRQHFVEEAKRTARVLLVPLIVISEEWTRHGMSNDAFISLCQNWGKWLAELERAGLDEKCVVRALPLVWRRAVYGDSCPEGRDALKRAAVVYAQRILKLPVLSDDVAEALMLGVWGQRAGEVHALLEAATKKKKAA